MAMRITPTAPQFFAVNATPENLGAGEFGFRGTSLGRDRPAEPQAQVEASGQALPADKRINNGVALAFTVPRPAGQAMGTMDPTAIAPTHTLRGDRRPLNIAGIRIELVAAPEQTADQLYVWLPTSAWCSPVTTSTGRSRICIRSAGHSGIR